ncbi:MAG TPA: VCBS repeat-containing protein, partial [Thermoanaerobaculia bacterium]
LAVGDINRDGDEDLAVANQFCCGTDVSGPALSILSGNGIGGFASPSNFAVGTPVFVPGPFAVVLADFNRDGQLDVALGDSGSRIWIYLACAAVRADIPTLGPLGLIVMGLLVALVALSRLNARG